MKVNGQQLEVSGECPIPIAEYEQVLLAHGSGGKLTHQLIKKIIVPYFKNALLEPMHDGALLPPQHGRLAFTTDSYVVDPVFFPGDNIGSLAVNGTINDLAMCGAKPLYLSCGLIIEEGFPMTNLQKIIMSMKQSADAANVHIVTGDTKVIDRGKGDGIFINTAGIGIVEDGIHLAPSNVRVGDRIILSGSVAEHGIAIMSAREGLEFESEIVSDTAPLADLVRDMVSASRNIHVLRDPTRGGVATTLNEIAVQANIGIQIREKDIPVNDNVRGACEILGFDPLYVANEGKLLAFVRPSDTDKVFEAMLAHPLGKNSSIIGEVVEEHAGYVMIKTLIGGTRLVDMLSGEQLPRIC